MARIDTNPDDHGEQIFHEYPKCMRLLKEDGCIEYKDALNSVDEEAAIAQGWEPNGAHDARAFDKAANAQALPDDYVPVEYPKFIPQLGRDVNSLEEEERLLAALYTEKPTASKLSLPDNVADVASKYINTASKPKTQSKAS